jgi:hypothetical protein
MAPPVSGKRSGSTVKPKPNARSLKRKKAVEDIEKLQKDVQELVSERLWRGIATIKANFLKGHKGNRKQEFRGSSIIERYC